MAEPRPDSNPASELVDIVDADNQVVRTVSRRQMREQRLPHRASYIVCQDSLSRYLVEVRTLSKDYAPGLLDACVGGVMQHGEEEVSSALRELEEELGVVPCNLKEQFIPLGVYKHTWADGRHFSFCYLYLAKISGITVRQRSEVSGLLSLSEQEVLALGECCARDSLTCFEEILRRSRERGLLI